MNKKSSLYLAQRLMQDFADHTGLTSHKTPKRYLWTDAFGVCNYLGFYEKLKESRYLDLALKLIDQVHEVLGCNKKEDFKLHPTLKGLRIGKALPQREPAEPFDEALEWERDGQYFHYLTKWMRALCRVTELTGDFRYNRWAMELAKVSFEKFSHIDPYSGQRVLYWKMSVELDRPLVESMGQHDGLDGWITFLQLQNVSLKDSKNDIDLSYEIDQLKIMAKSSYLPTLDPLGLGGLLCDILFLNRLKTGDDRFLSKMIETSLGSLKELILYQNFLQQDAPKRLAFRELGLCVGLKAVQKTPKIIQNLFEPYTPLLDEIISFWADENNRNNPTWKEHEEINSVSLATALEPEGYLA